MYTVEIKYPKIYMADHFVTMEVEERVSNCPYICEIAFRAGNQSGKKQIKSHLQCLSTEVARKYWIALQLEQHLRYEFSNEGRKIARDGKEGKEIPGVLEIDTVEIRNKS